MCDIHQQGRTLFCWLIGGIFVATAAGYSPALGQTADSDKNETWLSSVTWIDDHSLLASQSQGLLLRPGKVVQIALDAPSERALEPSAQAGSQVWQTLGESETSLWSALPLGDFVLASDYRGRVIKFHQQQATPMQLEARWIRKLVKVPDQPAQVVAGTEDGKLIVLSTESNTETQRAEVAGAAIFDIAFRPDRTQVAVACGDGSIHIRSWPQLDAVQTLPSQGQAVWSVLYSADGQHLLSGGADRKIRLWNVETGQPVVAISGSSDWITCLIALPESSLVAAGCLNGEIVVLDYQTLLPVQTVQAASSGIWGMALSPDGKQLALGTRRNGLTIISDLGPWYEAGKIASASAASNLPPEPQTASDASTAP